MILPTMLLLAYTAVLASAPIVHGFVIDSGHILGQALAAHPEELHAERRQEAGPWRTRPSRIWSTLWTSRMLTDPSPAPPPFTSPPGLSFPTPPVLDEPSISTSPPPVYTTRTGMWTIRPGATYSSSTLLHSSSSTTSTLKSTTAAMPTDSTSRTEIPAPSRSPESTPSSLSPSGDDTSGIGSNRTLVITLSTVLSVVGVLLIAGAILICLRYRRHRKSFFARGISPIDDDEIATWKVPRSEKAAIMAGETDVEAEGAAAGATAGGTQHGKHASTSSVKKPPSVIVYSNAHGRGDYRRSHDEEGSPRSFAQSGGGQSPYYGKSSLDKALPQTPIQARAPNARAGLTDESIPGDDPFLPSPKRHPSRLSKMPPAFSSQRRAHARTRSSRSSTHSFAGYGYVGSDVGLSTRHSHDNYTSNYRNHSRVYSSSSIPPRLSFGDDGPLGGLSPRPLFRDEEIGRAIG